MLTKYKFEESHLKYLHQAKEDGGNLDHAARLVGEAIGRRSLTRNTLAVAIVDAGFTEQVKEILPRFGTEQPTKCKHSGIRVIGLADLQVEPVVVPENVPARWLAKSWRVAA